MRKVNVFGRIAFLPFRENGKSTHLTHAGAVEGENRK